MRAARSECPAGRVMLVNEADLTRGQIRYGATGLPHTIECVARLAYAETLCVVGEFDLALKQAEATLDLATRCRLLLQESDTHAAAAAALDATAPSRAVQHRRHSAAIRHELGLPPMS